MKSALLLICMFFFKPFPVPAQDAAPQQALNHYSEFLGRAAGEVTGRFEMLAQYQNQLETYRERPDSGLRLPSSGPLEEYYYTKCQEAKGLTAAEKLKLNSGARSVWEILNKLDETGKALETYVRLNAYQNDNLKRSDELVAQMRTLTLQFKNERLLFYKLIQQTYRRYQPYSSSDPYLSTEREMEQVISSQQNLLDSLPYYLSEQNKSPWPVALVERSMLADQKLLASFGKLQARLPYPASDVIPNFRDALASMQAIKKRALDDYTFTARQSAQHGNEVYISLLKQFNQDLLVTQKAFVNYSIPAKRLLYYPAYSPVINIETSDDQAAVQTESQQFEDKPIPSFKIRRSAVPAAPALIRTLNGYIDFINESLRQMHMMQLLTRNYQSSAEYYRDPASAAKRAGLTYSHADFKIPVAAYQLLSNAASNIPPTYRASITAQAEVLLNMLKEMDRLSIELVHYTSGQHYLQDRLRRSDQVLDRYAVLFELFDKKKEQLYNDIRRVHESYPAVDPASSWYISGKSLLATLDDDKEVLFRVRAFLEGKSGQLPGTTQLQAGAEQLIADEYQNMKGLKRYGRSNGLCPYTPYEDLAGNSLRLVEKVKKVQPVNAASQQRPYESFYYFYNGELVYQYNKFVELAGAGLLKAVNQPDLFVFKRIRKQGNTVNPVEKEDQPVSPVAESSAPVQNGFAEKRVVNALSENSGASENDVQQRDTVYVERVRVDTVFVDRNSPQQNVTRSLEGFAANNMILLLDVSSSMNSPLKMPLLKRSIKSLLTLLRPEDQITIVLYSGKARIVLKPTSGAKATEIARMIDLLQSEGDTDGNEGLRLAYKTANKSYIRGGNNRIILATDGEFPVSSEVMEMIQQNARQDLYLTVLTFGRNAHMGQKLKRLSQLGQGTYAHVTEESADLQLILEAQSKRVAK